MTVLPLCRSWIAFVLIAAAAPSVAQQTITLSPVADATVFQDSGDVADSLGPGLFAGRISNGLSRRALLRFDIAGALPPNATVSSVTLRLSLDRTNADGVNMSLFPVVGSWAEGTSDGGIPGGQGAVATPGDATWTMRVYPSTPWTTVGGDTVATASATTQVLNQVGDYVWGSTPQLVADVQGWLAQPATNNGWQLRSDETAPPPTAKRFGSRSNTDAALRPVLTIVYGVPAGAVVEAPTLGAGAMLLLIAALVFIALRARRRGSAS